MFLKLAAKTKILTLLIMKLRLVRRCMCHVILICLRRRQSNFSHLMSLRLRNHFSPSAFLRLEYKEENNKNMFSSVFREGEWRRKKKKKKEIMIYLMSISVDGKFTSTEEENPMHKLLFARDSFLSFRLCSTDIETTERIFSLVRRFKNHLK